MFSMFSGFSWAEALALLLLSLPLSSLPETTAAIPANPAIPTSHGMTPKRLPSSAPIHHGAGYP